MGLYFFSNPLIHKQMTIEEIKNRTAETAPYFFTESTLRFFGQTLDMFEVSETEDGRFFISAHCYDSRGKHVGKTERFFNPETNNLEYK